MVKYVWYLLAIMVLVFFLKSNPRTSGILQYSPPHSPHLNMFGAEHDFDVDIPEHMAARIPESGFVCLEVVPGQAADIAYAQLKGSMTRAEHDFEVDIPEHLAARIAESGFVCLELVPVKLQILLMSNSRKT